MKLILLLLLISPTVTNAASCDRTLGFMRESFDSTAQLISYLNSLTEAQAIKTSEVASFANHLERGTLINPISQNRISTDSEALVHHGELQRQLKGPVDKQKLLAWAQEHLKDRQFIRTAREVSKDHTQEAYLKPEFRQITIGTKEPHTFEMMTTPVTQRQWVEVMGEDAAFHFDGEPSVHVNIGGKTFRLRPDNPVEHVTWYSALQFANRMSERAGLEPAYNLDAVVSDLQTRPENGTWQVIGGALRINAPDENIHLTKGYRLPSESEIVNIISLLHAQNKRAFEGEDTELQRHAWYGANSSFGTQPVSNLAPLKINGQPFYDFAGNVWEWSHSQFRDNPFAPGSTRFRSNDRFIYGGSTTSEVREVRRLDMGSQPPNHAARFTGFRLVRTLKK